MRRATVALLVLAWTAACTFERRPDLEASGQWDVSADSADVEGGRVTAEDSVQAVVTAIRDAFRVGDATRVVQLTVPGTVLYDQEEAIRWDRSGVGGRLPPPLGNARGGLGWERRDHSFSLVGGAALLVERYDARISGEEANLVATETMILVRTAQGWRLRHMHRSRGPREPGGGP